MADTLKDVNHIHPLENFVLGGEAYLPSEILTDKPRFMALLDLYLQRLKEIDEKGVALAEGRLLLNATGLNLDEIGQQVGIYRNGLEDPEYRAVITILRGSASKSGTRSEIISTLQQIFGVDNFNTYKGENYRVDINIFDACFEITSVIQEILDMLPLPTHLRMTESNDFGQPFGFDGEHYSIGFGSVHDDKQTGAGGLAHELYASDFDTF